MPHKNHYKKIFVIAAALFVLFAPVGMTMGGGAQNSTSISAGAPTTQEFAIKSAAPSPYSAFRLSFNLSLAAATPTPTAPTTGAGVGQNVPVNPDWYSCATSPVTCGVYYVALTLNGIMGLFVSLGATLVRLGLQLNDNVFNSPAVQTGFSVSLAIANLGFVLGIIIIAIATIIRNQTYGMKQLLWKLVFMAILVNFGLVITAPIVGFASSMSNYFINATSPTSVSIAGYEGYAQTMMSAFNPQAPAGSAAAGTSTTQGWSVSGGLCLGPWSYFNSLAAWCNKNNLPTQDPPDVFWKQTMAMAFDVVFSALIVFVFFCLAILLLIRYLMLAGLLIVLPLAWLTYIFPKFDNSFSKWWNTFIKWTFFPPIALFFIYLAFITATNTNTSGGAGSAPTSGGALTAGQTYMTQAIQIPNPTSTSTVEAGLQTQTGTTPGLIQTMLDEVLLVGLTIMGLMFANSLTGRAGKATVGAASGASKAFGTWVGKTGRQAAYSAAARVAAPKPRPDPATGAMYSPLTGPRADAARWLGKQAARKDLQTPGKGVLGKSAGLAASVWGGAKNGSGLFKQKVKEKKWECQTCGNILNNTKKPNAPCPSCGSTAAVANWTEIS